MCVWSNAAKVFWKHLALAHRSITRHYTQPLTVNRSITKLPTQMKQLQPYVQKAHRGMQKTGHPPLLSNQHIRYRF